MNIFQLMQTEWLYNSLRHQNVIGLNKSVVDAFQWLFETCLFVVILVCLIRLIGVLDRKKVIWHWLTRNIFPLFVIIWTLGFVVYCWGMYLPGANVFSFAPQAILQAFGMFLSQSDISLVQNSQHESALFMMCFSLSHFCAVALSLLFVIKHFGSYFSFIAKRWFATTMFAQSREDLYVFWGKCQGSILLAHDILKKQTLSQNSRVVMVHTSDDNQQEVTRLGIHQLVSLITLKDEELEQLQDDGCLVYKCYKRLSKLSLSDASVSILEDMLEQRGLTKLIRKKTKVTSTIRFFMLTEDYKANVDAVKNLLRDSMLQKSELPKEVYCLARPMEVEDLQFWFDNNTPEKITVHVIDASMLAISQLKKGVETNRDIYHPVQFMDVDVNAVAASSSFNGMVIGFGDTGNEALSFLYEFSAIPDAKGQKMSAKILALDKAMDEKKGLFYELHPAFIGQDEEIRLIQADALSETFLKAVSQTVRQLDYVIVCTGDDDVNLQIATRLFNYCYQHREGVTSRLGIFVCCTRKENCQRMTDMEHVYNESCEGVEMHVFGSPQDIFTHRLIVENTILKEAMDYNWSYSQASAKLEGNEQGCLDVLKLTPAEKWNNDFVQCEKKEKDKRQKKMIQIRQNISNSLHLDTKLALLGLNRTKPEDRSKLKDWQNIALQHHDSVRYPERQHEFDQLAICEHLRWEALMKMSGYVFTAGKKNERAKLNPCMRPLSELDEETQMYDYIVADTSFKIAVGDS